MARVVEENEDEPDLPDKFDFEVKVETEARQVSSSKLGRKGGGLGTVATHSTVEEVVM